MIIKDLEQSSRPREKAKRIGMRNLSDAELLAIIIGSGIKGANAIEIGNEMMKSFHHFKNMVGIGISQFKGFKGINDVKALQFEAIFEMQRRCLLENCNEEFSDVESIYSSYKDIVKSLKSEEVYLLFYDRNRKFIREMTYSMKHPSKVGISIAKVAQIMFEIEAKNLVIMHNHLSYSLEPSELDLLSTYSLKEKLDSLGLNLLDSLIINENGYFSFKESSFM